MADFKISPESLNELGENVLCDFILWKRSNMLGNHQYHGYAHLLRLFDLPSDAVDRLILLTEKYHENEGDAQELGEELWAIWKGEMAFSGKI